MLELCSSLNSKQMQTKVDMHIVFKKNWKTKNLSTNFVFVNIADRSFLKKIKLKAFALCSFEKKIIENEKYTWTLCQNWESKIIGA